MLGFLCCPSRVGLGQFSFASSMAALSSFTESHVKTIRITYQELLEAGNLDGEKKKKSPKRKSKENHEEEDSKDAVSPSKDERLSVDEQEESEAVDLETKKDSKKAENRSKEDKKDRKKKGGEKKKHRSRLHSDEKQSERKDDNEARTRHNKETREKTTEVDKTHDNSGEDSFDVEDKDKLKSKEEKKSTRRRSPSSGEKTADLEDHVAKLRLDDHGEEESSLKADKNTKKKTKINDEKGKKRSESKKKDKKKSDDAENSKKDSPDEIGKEQEKRKRKKDKMKIDDKCFEDEHKTHGILKSSPKLQVNHVHFSFSDDSVESHSCESNSAERGIIRIPEGIDIHHDENKIRGSAEFEEYPLEIEHDHDGGHDTGNDDVDDNEIVHTAERSHDMLCDKSSPDHDNPKIKTSDQEKVSTMEKRLKALNRQRAQQLIKQCRHTENSLSNLLAKGITDKASLHKICSLSKEIQDLYQGVIMLDLGLANHHDADQLLWKNAFYQVIETFRKYGKLFLGYSNQKNAMAPEEINEELYQFLDKASYFYSDLLEGLQKTHHFEVQEIVNQPRKADLLGRNAKLALLSCHHILIFLGDIQRYKEHLHASKGINWGTVRNWYLKASKLAPKNGKPYNQLAVIAVYANRKLDAVYYYIRSLAVSSPILTAKEKLTTIFHEIQRKADQVRQEEEMQRRQQECQKVAHERRDASRGHGRNIFREAAREVGLVSEKEPNSGRHEIWVFMRQGKCRRLVLTDQGKIQHVDATGTPITKEQQQEDNHRDPINESPKISLQEINKKFMLHFLCAHGLLYTRIGMERLPSLQLQLIGELHTLLDFPQCSSVSYISLLQMSAINMYAIDHTAPRENSDPFVRVGTPQDQALTLAMDMLISVLNACTELLLKAKEDDGQRDNNIGLSTTLRQFILTVKVWFDWLSSHQHLWQASSISIHRTLWKSIVQFANLLMQIELPDFEDKEDGEIIVTLNEDEFLAGFKPLADAKKYFLTIRDQQYKELVQDHLHLLAVVDFCRLMSSIPNPTMQYCQETGQYAAIITSIPASQPQDNSSVAAVHVDVDHEPSDPQEPYESDDVIVESVLEDIESGDEADKGFKELKAKKEKLAKELEDHKEKQCKARAVVHENVSRPHLVSENYPTFLVPDTNCFIDQLSGIQAIVMSGDFTLVVPLVVINELDGLKKDLMIDKYHDFSHAQMVMENARAAIDFLEDQFSLRSPNVKAVTSKGTVMDTIAFRSEDGTARTGNNDDVILSCCLHYCQENFVNRLATADQPITIRRKVVLLTDDRNLRVKAYTRNVPVLTVPQFRQMARL